MPLFLKNFTTGPWHLIVKINGTKKGKIEQFNNTVCYPTEIPKSDNSWLCLCDNILIADQILRKSNLVQSNLKPSSNLVIFCILIKPT
jgi:hypothetical protein